MSNDNSDSMSGKLVEPIFFFGTRGCRKSVFGEMFALEYFKSTENLTELIKMTNCENHKKLWSKELLIPIWSSNIDDMLYWHIAKQSDYKTQKESTK